VALGLQGGVVSHAIDLDGLEEKLFILRHLVHGTASFCMQDNISCEEDLEREFFHGYWGRLKVSVSNRLIECAIKSRMIEEFCAKDDTDNQLRDFEQQAVNQLNLGSVKQGNFKLTLREASNKIIHATRATIEFKSMVFTGPTARRWDGKYHLYGSHQGKPWHVELCVDSWAKSMYNFLKILEENEKTIHLGQDWS